MDNPATFCFICFEEEVDLINMNAKDCDDITYVDKFNFCSLGIDWIEDKLLLYMCKLCCGNLRIAYDFKELCMKNSSRLETYINQLKYVTETIQNLSLTQYTEEDLTFLENNIARLTENDDSLVDAFGAAEDFLGINLKFTDEILDDDKVPKKKKNKRKGKKYNTNAHVCRICEQKFSLMSLLKDHQAAHHKAQRPFKCVECKKTFGQKSHLDDHILTHTNTRPHSCTICNKTFFQKTHLTRHLSTHTGAHNKHSCLVCKKNFMLRSSLSSHMLCHSDCRPYACAVCKKTFMKRSHLNDHTLIHTGERKHVCQICNKDFYQKSHLTLHLLTHSQEKNYVCDICDKRFAVKASLKGHLLTHTGARPHSCVLCDRTFTKKSHLNDHVLLHTGDRPHRCNLCDRAFIQKSQLTKHVSINHKDEQK